MLPAQILSKIVELVVGDAMEDFLSRGNYCKML